MKDFYEILRVPPSASFEEIQQIFRSLAKTYHPDTTPLDDMAHATEKMKDLNEAYKVLSDPVKRAEYDRQREVLAGIGRKPIPPMPKVSPTSLDFGSLFHGEASTRSFQLENSGGPVAEINFTYSEENAWFSIINIEQFSETESFPMEIVVKADAHSLTSGDYRGWIEVRFDGATVKVNLALQVKRTLTSTAPLVRESPILVPRWAIVLSAVVVLGLAVILVAPIMATKPAASPVPVQQSVLPSAPPGEIAFSAYQDGVLMLQVVRADSTDIADWNLSGGSPNWSPDGNHLAFVSERSGESQLYLADAAGGNLTQLTQTSGVKSDPTWSPDGNRIAFILSESEIGALYEVDAQGTREQPLGNLGVGSVATFAWSPNGKQLLFDARQNGENRVYRIEADGTGLQRLTDFETSQPTWSPEGERAAVAAEGGIYTLNQDGGDRLRLTTFKAWAPAWAPDGRRIAFLADRGVQGARPDLWLMETNGQGQRRVTTAGCYGYVWSPDGQELAYLTESTEGGSSQLYLEVMNVETDARLRIGPATAGSLSWKP